jgi:nucleotide-binding universal stress UspA family protein
LQISESRDALDTACRLAAAERGIVVMMDRREAEIGMALVDLRLPVLAVPCATASLDPTGEALILWNGSKSTGHALAAALPLLRNAGRATILEIDDGSLRRAGSEAVALLARHGIAAHLQHDLAFGEKAGLLLLEQIAAIRPAYVVMGGFGHARWIESAIGGVTRRLLAECDVPLFLKH